MAEVVTIRGGVATLLGDIAHVSDLSWSTAWPYGCLEASWSMSLPPNTFPRALSAGSHVEVWDGPIRVWAGYLTEPVPGEPWTLHAKGWYAALANRLCLTADQSTTSAVPSVVIPAAIGRGPLPIVVSSTLAVTSLTSGDETINVNDALSLMNAYAESIGQRWGVDADYRLTVAADPTEPWYVLDSTVVMRGTADDDYVTDVYPRFVSAVDGATGDPTAWGLGHVATTSQPAGRRERAMDVTARGQMTQSAAETYAQAQLTLNGARMGYVEGVEPSFGELLRPGGTPARLGLVKAGQMLRSFNVADASGQVQLGMTADVVIGETRYTDGASTVSIKPVGMAPRTFVDSLQALQPKTEFDGTAA